MILSKREEKIQVLEISERILITIEEVEETGVEIIKVEMTEIGELPATQHKEEEALEIEKTLEEKETVRENKQDYSSMIFLRQLIIMTLEQKILVNQEIFGTCGQLKRCGIHWDEMGYSKGTADVEYFRTEDAKKAVEEYKSNII